MDISIVSASFIYSIPFRHSIYSLGCLTHWNEARWAHLKVLRHIDLLFRRIQLDDAFVSPFLLSLFLSPSFRPSCACVSSPHTHTHTLLALSQRNLALFHFGISTFFSFSPIFLCLFFYFLLFTSLLPVLMEILLYFLVSHISLDAPEATAKQWKLVLLLCLFFGCVTHPAPPSPLDTRVLLSLQRTACWLSLWLPPLWSSVTRGGGGAWKGNWAWERGFWQKTLAFYCPCYCCCIYLATVKAVRERGVHISASFAVFAYGPSPTSYLVLGLPQAGTLFAASAIASHFIFACVDGVAYYLIKSKM